MRMNKSYEEMMSFDSFIDRFKYLQLYGKVGTATFGQERYLNQILYQTPEWKSVRNQVIIRDASCDLAHPDYEIYRPPVFIHHINPITIQDILDRSPKVFDLNNLVMTTFNTHQAIHYGDNLIFKMDHTERHVNDTCPWKE